jgi:putative transposase
MNSQLRRRGMTKRKYSEGEIIAALKELEVGRNTADVLPEKGVSKHTVYAWKYDGLM